MPDLFDDSIWVQVVDAVANRVDDALANTELVLPTFRRKRPVLLETDPVPCVVVSPGPGGETIIFQAFGGVVVYGYPTAVVLFFPSTSIYTKQVPYEGGAAAKTDEEYKNVTRMKQVLRQAVYQPTLIEVPSVYDVDPPILSSAIEVIGTGSNASLYAVTAITVTHHSLENRSDS